ncbi:hypothetical protein EV356DRAFT_579223 [Viridothelium virens]|uniref:VOC domain-containing protein n=1 Tax=Viridothelium virens TaxID=1048519 RepID=A0A6A6H0K7_VIRVR|nr:hypothetical protein EV356DRAFT_579223 [Viridothelium virens]
MVSLLQLFSITLVILPRLTQACLGHALLQKRQLPGLNITLGNSDPQPPATVGYNLNHLAIAVPNLTASMDFYVNALGFREMFTLPITETNSFTYLAYPQGGRNGTGYQTAEEMTRQKNNAEGLLEIVYSESNNNAAAPHPSNGLGFSHLGFIVPSVTDTQSRLENFKATIVKRSGEPFTEEILQKYFGVQAGQVSQQQVAELGDIFTSLLLALDPTGYLLEFQQQDP